MKEWYGYECMNKIYCLKLQYKLLLIWKEQETDRSKIKVKFVL